MIISSTGQKLLGLHCLEYTRKKKFRPLSDPEMSVSILFTLYNSTVINIYNFDQKGTNTTSVCKIPENA